MIASKNTLLPALLAVGKAISKRVVIPILEDILFDLDGDTLTLTASDLQVTIKASCKVESKETTKIALPGELVIQTIKSLPEGPITFMFNKKDFTCTICGDSGTFKLSGEDGTVFPIPPAVEETSIPMSATVLHSGLQRTTKFTGQNEFKPEQMCVFIETDKDEVLFTATADNVLSHVLVSNSGAGKSQMLLPQNAASVLKDLFIEGDVIMSFNKTNLCVSNKDITFVCRLSDEKFPNYRAIFPVNYAMEVIVERELLSSALNRVLIYAKENLHMKVAMKFTKGMLHLQSDPTGNGNYATERVMAEYDGEDFAINVNSKWFLTVMSVMESPNVIIKINDYDKPVVVIDESYKEGSYCLLMPIA